VLRRPPENAEVIQFHRERHDTMAELMAAMMASEEYRTGVGRDVSVSGAGGSMEVEEIDTALAAFMTGNRMLFQGKTLALPAWFDVTLAPDSAEYRAQLLRLWQTITAREDYDPDCDEDTPEVAAQDFLRRPAFYAGGDTAVAGGHLMAIGHILLRSELPPGGRVLEYGSGFGQTSLAFARTGAKVDTVDVNAAFCRGVRKLGRHYKVELNALRGQFGTNPAEADAAYDLILFYESFHHCFDPVELIAKLRTMLRPGGKVILAGEPIFALPSPEMPYPWGFRLDWENVAIMRQRGWMELGYQEDYLLKLFAAEGFVHEIFSDPNSHWAQVYRFKQRD
jgi:SAM-dependent methyltransferase